MHDQLPFLLVVGVFVWRKIDILTGVFRGSQKSRDAENITKAGKFLGKEVISTRADYIGMPSRFGAGVISKSKNEHRLVLTAILWACQRKETKSE